MDRRAVALIVYVLYSGIGGYLFGEATGPVFNAWLRLIVGVPLVAGPATFVFRHYLDYLEHQRKVIRL